MHRTGWVESWTSAGALAVLAMAILSLHARAEDATQAATQAARAARLSNVDGQVQIAQDGQILADPAVANTPLFEGALVTAAENGRAEIQFEDGGVARLSPASSLSIKVLPPQGDDAEIVLEGGLGYFELLGASSRQRIRFGDTVVTASGFTVIRINLDNPPGEVAVFSGNAHLERGNALALDLHGGESVSLNGADPTRYNLAESIEPDSWDSWNADRDQVLSAEETARTKATNSFANNANPAWGDLDSNGNWYNVGGAGYVWSPYDASTPGWDPYGNGYWMWTPRFGYIWVSGNSWGYMPYQCGAWNFYDGFGWGWAPGMSGCPTWWGLGGYYGPNIGFAPGGYAPPRWPHRPIGGPPGGRPGPHPVIAVNRRPSSGGSGLVARDRNAPVTIAGQTVQALRPVAPRPQYDRSTTGSANGARPGYVGANGRSGYAAFSSASANQRTGRAVTSGGSTSSHVSSPSPSHSSSGGGSSSSRPSGGNSGGGSAGGGSHTSSGGSSSGGSHR